MDKMKQDSFQKLREPVEFPGYKQLQTSLIKTLNDLGVDSGVITVVNNDDNPREAGKARARFTFRRRGKGVEVEAFGITGELWPEEDFKAWWKKALAGEKTQFNLNYGFFAFKLSEIGPKLSVAKRAEAAKQEAAAPSTEPRAEKSAERIAPEPDEVRDVAVERGGADDFEEPASPESVEGTAVSEDVILEEYADFQGLRDDLIRVFAELRQAAHADFREQASAFLYVQQGGEIVGDGYELTHPRGGARVVKTQISGSDTSVFAPGFEKMLVASIRAQGIGGAFSYVITREKLPE